MLKYLVCLFVFSLSSCNSFELDSDEDKSSYQIGVNSFGTYFQDTRHARLENPASSYKSQNYQQPTNPSIQRYNKNYKEPNGKLKMILKCFKQILGLFSISAGYVNNRNYQSTGGGGFQSDSGASHQFYSGQNEFSYKIPVQVQNNYPDRIIFPHTDFNANGNSRTASGRNYNPDSQIYHQQSTLNNYQ